MILRVSDILEEIAPFVDGGGSDWKCEPGRSQALRALNRATRFLLDQGDWEGAEQEICITVDQCCVTLDERFLAIRRAKLRNGGQRLKIHNQNFKYTDSGPGELSCCGCISQIVDLGDGFPLHRDLTRALPITAWSDRNEAVGVCLEIRGTDAKGKEVLRAIPIRNSIGQDGRPPAYTPADRDYWTDGRFATVRELRKPKTAGYVYVYGYEPATGELCWIATLRPETQSPCHRRYMIPTDSCDGEIVAAVSLRYVPMSRDDEIAIIQNTEAIISMVQAFSAKNRGDIQQYEFNKNSALNVLKAQKNKRDRGTFTQPSLKLGGSPLKGAKYSVRPTVGSFFPSLRKSVEPEQTAVVPCEKGKDGRDAVPWQPVYAIVPDGSRRVMRIVDWFGGIDPKPETGQYLGPNGYVSDIGDATDIRGEGGGGSLGTFTASIELAGHRWVNVDSSGQLRYADAALLREAHGLIVQSVAAGQPVEVFNGGKFAGFAGLTGGGSLYLSTNGQQSHTAPGSGLSQQVAVAKDADEIFIDIEEPTEL